MNRLETYRSKVKQQNQQSKNCHPRGRKLCHPNNQRYLLSHKLLTSLSKTKLYYMLMITKRKVSLWLQSELMKAQVKSQHSSYHHQTSVRHQSTQMSNPQPRSQTPGKRNSINKMSMRMTSLKGLPIMISLIFIKSNHLTMTKKATSHKYKNLNR